MEHSGNVTFGSPHHQASLEVQQEEQVGGLLISMGNGKLCAMCVRVSSCVYVHLSVSFQIFSYH